MDGKASIMGCLDDVDPNRFHWRSCPKGMSTGLGRFVNHTPLTKDTTPPDKSGSEAHPFLKGCRFNGLNNLDKLARACKTHDQTVQLNQDWTDAQTNYINARNRIFKEDAQLIEEIQSRLSVK